MTDEAAQIAAWREELARPELPRLKVARDACDLAERLLRERDQWKMFHDSLTKSGAVVVNELQRETGRANRAERLLQERDAARAELEAIRPRTATELLAEHHRTYRCCERAKAAEARVRALEVALGIEIRERQRLATENSILRGEAQIGL